MIQITKKKKNKNKRNIKKNYQNEKRPADFVCCVVIKKKFPSFSGEKKTKRKFETRNKSENFFLWRHIMIILID